MNPRLPNYEFCRHLLFALLLLIYAPAHAESQTVNIEDTRPVAKAVEKLESTYLIPISYEDMRYLQPGDWTIDEHIVSATLKRQSLVMTYETPRAAAPVETNKPLAANAIAAVMQSFNSMRGKAIFSMTSDVDGFHVIAKQEDANGKMAEHPLLDTPLTIVSGNRSALQAIVDISNALTAATGVTVLPGMVPMPLFSQVTTNIGVVKEPARAILTRLIHEIPVGYLPEKTGYARDKAIPTTMSWKLLCTTPNSAGECALNIQIVAPEDSPPVGMGSISLAVPR